MPAERLSGGSDCNLIHSWIPHHLDMNGQFHASASLQAGSADQRGDGGAGTNYRVAAVGRGALGPIMLHLFSYFSVVSLSVDCTN